MTSIRIDAVLTDEQREKAKAGLALLNEAMPFLVDLTAKQRAEMAKFGEKNRSFVVKALAIAEEHPDMLPGSFSLEEFRDDVLLVESLYPIRHAVETLFGKIDDTYFAAGSESYAAALLVYQYAKLHNIATGALEDSVDDLARRFARKSKKPTPPTSEDDESK